jgi:hypothetical protein
MEIVDAAVQSAFAADTDRAFQKLMKDRTRIFWVTWSQPDETIVHACEAVLKTGALSAQRTGQLLAIHFRGRTEHIELTGEPEDRHATILALNKILAPTFEVRFVWESIGADAGAFLPLPCVAWHALEVHMPETLARRVLVPAADLNVFTQLTPSMKPPSPPQEHLPAKPWWKLWA